MDQKAFQDYYPDESSYCYGCGRLNQHGLQLKSYWDGEESKAVYTPLPQHMAIPGYVYGGLIASIIDCGLVSVARHILTPASRYSGKDSIAPPRRLKTQVACATEA